MRIFSKKICPLCKNKMGFITFRLSGNEKICTTCEKLFRGRFNLIQQGAAFYDPLNGLSLSDAKQIADEMRAAQQDDISRFKNLYSGVIFVTDVFSVPNVGLDEGGEAVTALMGKPVALGFCEYGSFKQGDRVYILSKDEKKETTILSLIPCTGAYSFEEELISKIHKTECFENTNAWLVLDLEKHEIKIEDKIVKD